MGLNICIYDSRGENEIKEWSFLREGHDREFVFELIEWENRTYYPNDCFTINDTDIVRKKLERLQWDNKERYMQLLDLVDKGFLMFISV